MYDERCTSYIALVEIWPRTKPDSTPYSNKMEYIQYSWDFRWLKFGEGDRDEKIPEKREDIAHINTYFHKTHKRNNLNGVPSGKETENEGKRAQTRKKKLVEKAKLLNLSNWKWLWD